MSSSPAPTASRGSGPERPGRSLTRRRDARSGCRRKWPHPSSGTFRDDDVDSVPPPPVAVGMHEASALADRHSRLRVRADLPAKLLTYAPPGTGDVDEVGI